MDRTTSITLIVGTHGNTGAGYIITEHASGSTTTGKVRWLPIKLPAWTKRVPARELGFTVSAYGLAYRYERA